MFLEQAPFLNTSFAAVYQMAPFMPKGSRTRKGTLASANTRN
ncbi:hypothetical protein ABIC45_002883 [Mucilaginibacter rubeus]